MTSKAQKMSNDQNCELQNVSPLVPLRMCITKVSVLKTRQKPIVLRFTNYSNVALNESEIKNTICTLHGIMLDWTTLFCYISELITVLFGLFITHIH